MKTCWIALFSLLITRCGNAQVLHTIFSAGYNSTVAGSKKFADVSSFLINQASLAEIKKISATVYSENRYLLKELKSGSIGIAFPLSAGGLGIAAGLSGFAGYNESEMGIAYGKSLGSSASIGAQINYNMVHMEGYGNAAAIGFELGATIQATKTLYASLHVCNPVGGRFGHVSQDKLASIYTISFGYGVSENLLLSMQIKKPEKQPVDIGVSMHYAVARQFFIRAGTATSSGSLFAGFGLNMKQVRMDIIGNYHVQLGITPGLQFIVQFQKEAE